MKNVNAALKNEIKDQAETSRAIRTQINNLKWKSEAREKVAALKSAHRVNNSHGGKTELKPFHRPETGPVRHALWDEKRSEGDKTRYLLLAYGALRGRSYAQVEPRCAEENQPSAYRIWNAMPDHVYTEVAAVWTEKAIESWLTGTPIPFPVPVVQARVETPVMQATA